MYLCWSFADGECTEGAAKCKQFGTVIFGGGQSLEEDFVVRTIEQVRISGKVSLCQ